jgi:hypothetical protein
MKFQLNHKVGQHELKKCAPKIFLTSTIVSFYPLPKNVGLYYIF